jgi:hypothetical protein
MIFGPITDYYLNSLSTEVKLNSKYVPIPQCIKLGTKLTMSIPFIEGKSLCIYLINWSEYNE